MVLTHYYDFEKTTNDNYQLSTMTTAPRDGPATAFEADPFVSRLLSVTEHNDTISDEFSLVVVAGWPPDTDAMERQAKLFLESVRQCFQEEDCINTAASTDLTLEGSSSLREAAVYLYPVHHFHVTVATLHSMNLETKNEGERSKLKHHWTQVIRAASERPEWPKSPLQLTIKSAQIGSRAGILLWEETSGGLDCMRQCIAEETSKRQDELQKVGIDMQTLSIPGIVHSTFLRFHKVPSTKGDVVQKRFQTHVLPRLKQDFFSTPITLTDAKLVCERIPYMHIPVDENHVFDVYNLDPRLR